MIGILVPSFPDVEAALDWLETQGEVIRVCLMRGDDGMVRGNALLLRGRS